jgi:hypothetical protein
MFVPELLPSKKFQFNIEDGVVVLFVMSGFSIIFSIELFGLGLL